MSKQLKKHGVGRSDNVVNFHHAFQFAEDIAVQGYDLDRRVVYWNRGSELLYGFQQGEAIGRKLEDLIIPTELRNDLIRAHRNWLEYDIPIPPTPLRLCRADDTEVEVLSTHLLLKTDCGQLQMYCLDVDLSTLHDFKARAEQGEQVLNSVFQSLPDLFFLMDNEGLILEYRARKSDDLYAPPEAFVGKLMQHVVPPQVGRLFVKNLKKVNEGLDTATFEYSMELPGGRKQFEARLSRLANHARIIAIVRDLSLQKSAEEALKNSQNVYRQMFENNLAVKLIIRPEDGAIIDMNRAGLQFYGYSAEDLEHLTVADLDASGGSCLEKGTADESGVYLGAQNNEAKQLCFQSRHRLKNGEIRDVEIYSGPLDFQGISYRYSIIHDVSERKAAERHMLHQAHYDALTNIPNRFLALDRLSQLMIEATRQSDKLAVMFLDLDDFKKINDSLGHESGDLLLIEASRRLTAVTRADDTVGRLGGDEFIILLRGLKTVIPAQHVAESILEQFRKPFLIDGHELILTVSIGIAIYPTDGKDTSSLLRHSDIAMYKAKERGRNTYSFFTDSMNQAVSYRLSLEEQLHGALKRGELEVYYQPQVDLASSEVIGAEALLRWHNHVLGDVSPVDFIPVAEHTGLIVSIGKFVITQVLDTLVECCDKRTDKQGDFRIAVNLSPRQLRDLSLVSFVTEALEKANLDSHSLELEITEGVLMMGHGYIDDSLKRLSEAGIAISMDDFGTGYSSLSYLRQYPFDLLKIDRSFVDGVAEAGADRELVLATIAMAHALGLKVIAEGVETEAQRDALKQLQCDYAQGYLYGKAAPKAAFFKLIGLAG